MEVQGLSPQMIGNKYGSMEVTWVAPMESDKIKFGIKMGLHHKQEYLDYPMGKEFSFLKTKVYPRGMLKVIVLVIMDGYLNKKKRILDMLNLVKFILLFVGLLVVFSCDRKPKIIEDASATDLRKVSMSHSGKEAYNMTYRSVLDSLQGFSENRLDSFKDITGTKWHMDSLICFNKLKDKCIMAFYVQYGEQVSNGLNYLYGVKIKERWYFFRGPHLYIQSEAYGFQKDTPLPFTKLHEIAMDNIFKGYLKKNKESGKWEINDAFFARFYERDAYNFPFTTKEAWEESWLRLMRENWKKRDTADYQSVQ